MTKSAEDYRALEKRHPFDESLKPRWGTGPDGRYVDISADDRFDSLFTAWQADACDHERTGIIRWANSGGQTCYNWFCAHCGTKLSSNVNHEVALAYGIVDREDANLDAMASRHNAYMGERKKHLDALADAAAERAQPINRAEYSEELQSLRWRDLRDRVLRRAGHQCEGCLNAPAEHVHHLTYVHRGNEFAFELRALCRDCHERWHESEAAE